MKKNNDHIQENISLKKYSTFGIGGLATFKYLVDKTKAAVSPQQAGAIPKLTPPEEKPKVLTSEFYNLLDTFNPPSISVWDDTEAPSMDLSEEQRKCLAKLALKMQKLDVSGFREALVHVKDSPEKFLFVVKAAGNVISDQSPKLLDLLENCEWPSVELKRQYLWSFLADELSINGIEFEDEGGFVRTGQRDDTSESSGFNCDRLLVHTAHIVDHDNFTKNPKAISPYLAEAIGFVLRREAPKSSEHLKRNVDAGNFQENEAGWGFEVVIDQSGDTKFPATMIAPLLFHLEHLYGLVSLDISDVQPGFQDEHVDPLLEVLRTNPHLQSVNLNLDGMSDKKKAHFDAEWEKLLKEPGRVGKPSVYSYLPAE